MSSASKSTINRPEGEKSASVNARGGHTRSTAVWICEYPYRTMRMEGPSSDCSDCPVWFEMQRSRHAAMGLTDDIEWLEELTV